jgi:hypothetical protein
MMASGLSFFSTTRQKGKMSFVFGARQTTDNVNFPHMVRIAIMAVMALVIGFAIYLTGKGVVNVWHAWASTQWPRSQGIVTAASESISVERDRHASTTFYSANTTIRYRVQGRNYTTGLIHFGQTFGSSDPSEAAMQLLRYPVGAVVSVSYNPSAPSIAVNRPGIHADAFWLVGAGLAFLLPSAMCLAAFPGILGRGDAEFGRVGAGMVLAAGIFGVIFCVLGILALSYGSQNLWNAHASQSWPTAPGTVVSASISKNRVHISSEMSNRSDVITEPPVESTYIFGFVYAYNVGGATHYGNLRRFGGYVGASDDWAARAARRYPVGSKVIVAFHPGDPDLAVLEPGILNEALVLPGFGALAILFGIAVLIFIVPGVSR